MKCRARDSCAGLCAFRGNRPFASEFLAKVKRSNLAVTNRFEQARWIDIGKGQIQCVSNHEKLNVGNGTNTCFNFR